ncbi:odorant receptor 67c-like [Rhagoletis pomonella]|uniref:odorant receptor 67c-like n=1 Tax=Rhagoletis pomonella TaxID=28610 RepID=UPI00177C618D|nr:odorant receptor 67c-like [Rhagoletis pomonella]
MPSLFESAETAPTIADFVKIPLFLLSLNGEKLFKWTPDEPPSRKQKILLRNCCMIILFNVIAMILFFFFGHLESALDYTALTIYWGFALNSFMKGGTLWVGRHKLEFVIKGLMARHPKTPEQRHAFRLVPYYQKIIAYNKYLTIWHLGTTSLFNLHPIVSSTVEYIWRKDKEQGFNYRFPFMMWYYYDEKKPIFYLFSYLMQCCGSYCVSFLFLGADLLLITLVHVVNMHFEYLGRYIEEFQPSGTDEDIEVLEPLVTYHLDILGYAERIDSTFSLSILLNYMGSCMVLCLIGVQLVGGTEFLSIVKFLAFLIATMVHVYFISYFGNNLIDLSSGISDAFYNHAWYKANYKYMRLLVLPIARAQRYAHLTAFQFFEISMNSFKSLCTTSYQFFTLLRTSLEEKPN